MPRFTHYYQSRLWYRQTNGLKQGGVETGVFKAPTLGLAEDNRTHLFRLLRALTILPLWGLERIAVVVSQKADVRTDRIVNRIKDLQWLLNEISAP
jgi:hypothetical protein